MRHDVGTMPREVGTNAAHKVKWPLQDTVLQSARPLLTTKSDKGKSNFELQRGLGSFFTCCSSL